MESSNFRKNSKSQKKSRKESNKLIWHWELSFKDALVIFVTWGEILCLQFTTWFLYVLNLLEYWPVDLVEVGNI